MDLGLVVAHPSDERLMDRCDVEFHGVGFEERTTDGLGPQYRHEGDRFGGVDELGGGNERPVLFGQDADAVDLRG